MQPIKTVCEALKWSLILMALLGSLAAGWLQPPAAICIASCSGSGYGDDPAAGTRADDRIARAHESAPRRGDPTPGQWHHSETPVYGRLRCQGRHVLYQIDPAPFQAALDSAKASSCEIRGQSDGVLD